MTILQDIGEIIRSPDGLYRRGFLIPALRTLVARVRLCCRLDRVGQEVAVRVLYLGLALLAGGCQHQMGPAVHPGLAFAQASCGGCHAVERYPSSPNPDAPPFAAIVNQEGLTHATLATWLRDAHNYPEEMEFSLDQAEVDQLVAYMLTLSDERYRPAI